MALALRKATFEDVSVGINSPGTLALHDSIVHGTEVSIASLREHKAMKSWQVVVKEANDEEVLRKLDTAALPSTSLRVPLTKI